MSKFILAVTDYKMSGFRTISPVFGENPLRISEYIDDGEAQELILDDILSYCPTSQILHYLRAVSKKLAHGGQLVVRGLDVLLLSEGLIRGELNIIQYNQLMFGEHNHAWSFKQSALHGYDVLDICEQLGLKNKERSINGFYFTYKFERV